VGNKVQLIYRLNDINAEEGIDVFEIAPILMSFGELIRSANDVLGYNQKIDIKVKPFKEGSWITEFVLQNKPVSNLLNYLHSEQGEDLLRLLAFLGLNVSSGIFGVAEVIRFTKGCVGNFRKDKNGKTVTYENEQGEKLTVSLLEHRLIQSPLVQVNYYNSVVTPLDKFPTATSLGIKVNQAGHTEQVFTEQDKQSFEQYANTELLEDVEDNVSQLNGVFVKPKRGSYSGEEKAYSFIMGDTVLWPVTIADEDFLNKLRSGAIRPYSEDVLKVDLEIIQKKDSSNKLLVSYSIKKVSEYIQYEKPKQMKLD